MVAKGGRELMWSQTMRAGWAQLILAGRNSFFYEACRNFPTFPFPAAFPCRDMHGKHFNSMYWFSVLEKFKNLNCILFEQSAALFLRPKRV